MGGIKKRGIVSVNRQVLHGDRVIVPTLWARPKGGNRMVGTYKDTGEMVRDEHGEPIPFRSIPNRP